MSNSLLPKSARLFWMNRKARKLVSPEGIKCWYWGAQPEFALQPCPSHLWLFQKRTSRALTGWSGDPGGCPGRPGSVDFVRTSRISRCDPNVNGCCRLPAGPARRGPTRVFAAVGDRYRVVLVHREAILMPTPVRAAAGVDSVPWWAAGSRTCPPERRNRGAALARTLAGEEAKRPVRST